MDSGKSEQAPPTGKYDTWGGFGREAKGAAVSAGKYIKKKAKDAASAKAWKQGLFILLAAFVAVTITMAVFIDMYMKEKDKKKCSMMVVHTSQNAMPHADVHKVVADRTLKQRGHFFGNRGNESVDASDVPDSSMLKPFVNGKGVINSVAWQRAHEAGNAPDSHSRLTQHAHAVAGGRRASRRAPSTAQAAAAGGGAAAAAGGSSAPVAPHAAHPGTMTASTDLKAAGVAVWSDAAPPSGPVVLLVLDDACAACESLAAALSEGSHSAPAGAMAFVKYTTKTGVDAVFKHTGAAVPPVINATPAAFVLHPETGKVQHLELGSSAVHGASAVMHAASALQAAHKAGTHHAGAGHHAAPGHHAAAGDPGSMPAPVSPTALHPTRSQLVLLLDPKGDAANKKAWEALSNAVSTAGIPASALQGAVTMTLADAQKHLTPMHATGFKGTTWGIVYPTVASQHGWVHFPEETALDAAVKCIQHGAATVMINLGVTQMAPPGWMGMLLIVQDGCDKCASLLSGVRKMLENDVGAANHVLIGHMDEVSAALPLVLPWEQLGAGGFPLACSLRVCGGGNVKGELSARGDNKDIQKYVAQFAFGAHYDAMAMKQGRASRGATIARCSDGVPVQPLLAAPTRSIVVYVSDGCGFCSLLQDAADAVGIQYEKRNVAQHPLPASAGGAVPAVYGKTGYGDGGMELLFVGHSDDKIQDMVRYLEVGAAAQ